MGVVNNSIKLLDIFKRFPPFRLSKIDTVTNNDIWLRSNIYGFTFNLIKSSGEVVKSGYTHLPSLHIDVSEFEAGEYFITAIPLGASVNAKMETNKFLIVKE